MTEERNFLKSRTIRWTAVILLVVAAGAAGALWRGGSKNGHHHETVDASEHDAHDAKTQMYYCSMHPQVRSPDKDDKCPICFMDLIPLPAEDDAGDDETEVPRLRLSARAKALMDVRTWPVERRQVTIEIDLFGKVGYDESRLYDVVARTEAYVERLFVNTPWQPVAKDEVLAELYSPAVVTAFRELLIARDGATDVMAAARARLIRQGVSVAQIDETLESGDVQRTFRVESLVAGMALPMVVREGEWLREGGRLTRIADLSRVWVNLEAYERDLAWLATGQKVQFHVAAYPGETFEGKIIFIDPVINERSRTARLRIEADNPDGRLKPEMLVSATGNATIPPSRVESRQTGQRGAPDEIGESALPLVIPAAAPLFTGRRAMVYVRLRDEDRPTFEPRRIILGPRAGDVYIVSAGLEEGDLVVVNGQFKIDSELQIRGRPSMMAPEGGAPPSHDHGGADHGGTDRGGTDRGGADRGGADRGGADRGGTDRGGTDRGRADRGGADHVGHGADADAPRLQTECPVMGGAINTNFYADVKGYRIFVCCPGCDQTVLDDPDTYLEKMKAEGITPYKLQTHCPIMGGEINREFFHDHDGKRIYVCCPGCLDEIRERAGEIIEEQRKRGLVFESIPQAKE